MLVYAPNIHCGGGLVLLRCLFQALEDDSIVIIDQRLPISDDKLSKFTVYRVRPTLWHRLKAEVLLRNLALSEKAVLCFGNLPPLFKLQAKVTLFIQNRYLLESNLVSHMPFKLRLRLGFEKFWLKCFHGHADKVLVQTPSMRNLAIKCVSTPVEVAPFVRSVDMTEAKLSIEAVYDFVYVASGESHKNHRNLLLAWKRLAEEGLFPTLCLTVDGRLFPELVTLIGDFKLQYNLRIENLGVLEHGDVLSLYRQSKALIFPSTLESFGLPLIEAKAANLKVVASEMDYVRDILDPDESFDPESSVSIMRSVKRYLRVADKKCDLLSPSDFLSVLRNIE